MTTGDSHSTDAGIRLIALVILAVVFTAPSAQSQPRIPSPTDPATIEPRDRTPGPQHEVAAYFDNGMIGAFDIAPDGREVVYVAGRGGALNLWKSHVDSTESWRFVRSSEILTGPSYSHDGATVAFMADRGGNGVFDIFTFSKGDSVPVNRSRTTGATERTPLFSPTDELLAFQSNEERPQLFQIQLSNTATGEKWPFTRGPVSYELGDWTADGAGLVVSATGDGQIYNGYLYTVSTGKHRLLTEHTSPTAYFALGVSPDEREVLVASDDNPSRILRLGLRHIESGEMNWLSTPGTNVEGGLWSRDGKWIVWTEAYEGRREIVLYDVVNSRAGPLAVPPGINTDPRFSGDSRSVGFVRIGAQHPPDIWRYTIDGGGLLQMTHSAHGGISPDDLVPSRGVAYRSTEDVTVPGFLYLPDGIDRDGSYPAVVMIHDGPTSEHPDGYTPQIQYYVNRGFVVLAPNPRGSTGWGGAYDSLLDGRWGTADLADLIAGTRFLEETGYVDRARIAAIGMGYGGYLALRAAALYPDRIAAAVAVSAPLSLATWHDRLPPRGRQQFRARMGTPGDPKLRARLEQESPLGLASSIRRPVALYVGDADPWLDPAEREHFVEAVTAAGTRIEVKTYPSRFTGLVQPAHMIDWVDNSLRFLDSALK